MPDVTGVHLDPRVEIAPLEPPDARHERAERHRGSETLYQRAATDVGGHGRALRSVILPRFAPLRKPPMHARTGFALAGALVLGIRRSVSAQTTPLLLPDQLRAIRDESPGD